METSSPIPFIYSSNQSLGLIATEAGNGAWHPGEKLAKSLSLGEGVCRGRYSEKSLLFIIQ